MTSLEQRKATNRARCLRRFARHRPEPKGTSYPAGLMLQRLSQREACHLSGVPEYLQQVVRMQFGAPGTWGHGRYLNGTKKGPGRRPLGWTGTMHLAGTKLVKSFIRDARGEQLAYRETYAALTGEQFHTRYS